MQALTQQFNGKTLILDEWNAFVPEVTSVDATTMKAYSNFFRTKGMEVEEASKETMKRMQRVFEKGFRRYLTLSIRRRMMQYAKSFPERIQEDGRLRGFDAAEIAKAYVPGENVGRRGRPSVKTMMEKMGR